MSTSPSSSGPVVPLDSVEACLYDLVSRLEPDFDQPAGRGRPRILPATCLWAGMLVCVVRGFSSQLQLWRLLRQVRLWDYPRFALSDQAIYNRLASAGTRPLEQMFAQISSLLTERLGAVTPAISTPLAPFASAVVAIDETTLDPVARRLPAAEDGPRRRLPGTLAGVFDLRLQQWHTIVLRTDTTQNEKVLARSLVADLPTGSLILADLGYFAFRWFDDLSDAGQYWVSRLRTRTSYEVQHVFFEQGTTFDGLIWLGVRRADRTKHLVRLVQFQHGNELRSYITNVRDPERLSLREIAELYARRWDIEMAVQLVKQHLGLRLWWGGKDVVIQQQVLAVLIIAQIVQALRVEVAARAGVPLFDVSLPLLVRYVPQFAARGEDPVTMLVEHGRAAGIIRPARRIRIEVPDPALAYAWSIHPVTILRPPRYAERNCGPRPPRTKQK